jgi:hypothetical protein
MGLIRSKIITAQDKEKLELSWLPKGYQHSTEHL